MKSVSDVYLGLCRRRGWDPDSEVERAMLRYDVRSWYREDIERTLKAVARRFPEVASRDGRALFLAILAITSQGETVRSNYQSALSIFEDYLNLGHARYVTEPAPNGYRTVVKARTAKGEDKSVGGPRLRSVTKNMQRLDRLVGPGLELWLISEHTGRDMGDAPRNVTAGGTYYGTDVFGPKIGAFLYNMLQGGGRLVTDVWWCRTWNRWHGTPWHGRVLAEAPRNKSERRAMQEYATHLALGHGLSVDELQALLWYHEKELYESRGAIKSERASYSDVC